jgi:pilus assembly protein CpaE
VERVREATTAEVGTFAGDLHDYSIHEGDLQPLLKLQNADVPVCVVDFDRDRQLAVQVVNSLRQMMRGRTTIIAISEHSETELVLEAMRAGCNEYLIKPLVVDQVRESFARLSQRITESQAQKSGKILAFLGCRGGAGTTTAAVHLATFLAHGSGKKILIIDQHASLGHVALYLGQDSIKYDFYELVRNVARLDQTLLAGFVAQHSSGIDVLPSPGVLSGTLDISVDAIERTIKFLANLYDFVIIDCARGISHFNLVTIDCCDELFMIATPDVPALRDLSRYVDRLLQCNVPPSKLRLVVNRYSSEGAVTLEQIEKSIRLPISITLPNNSAELIGAMNTGTPISPDRKCDYAIQMNKLAASLLSVGDLKPTVEPKRKFSFWKRGR